MSQPRALAPARGHNAGSALGVLCAALLHVQLVHGAAPVHGAARAGGQQAAREPVASACFDQHESGQELRQSGKLLQSRSAFLACAASECPGAVQRDCERWSSEVQAQLPSVVFRVSLDGKARSDASLRIDGAPRPNALLVLDPGRHHYRVALATARPVEGEFELQAGQPVRQIALELHAPGPSGGIPTWSWVLGGVGLGGTATFIGFGLSSRALEQQLEQSCAPLCSDQQIDRVRRRSLIANISLGVGLTSLLGAGALYLLSRPTQAQEPEPAGVQLRLVPVDGGALGNLRVRAF